MKWQHVTVTPIIFCTEGERVKVSPTLAFVMELNRHAWHAMIFYDFSNGLRSRGLFSEFVFYISRCCSFTCHSFYWYNFKRGKRSLEDAPRSGRQSTCTTESNIEKIVSCERRSMNPTWCNCLDTKYQFQEREFDPSWETFTQEKCSRWIPHQLMDKKKKKGKHEMVLFHEKKKINDGTSKGIWNAITGEESWIHQFERRTINIISWHGSTKV